MRRFQKNSHTEYKMQRLSACLLASLVAAFVGCSDELYPLAEVTGLVTLDGEALPNARINFEPRRSGNATDAGPGSYGKTDAQGRYSLETLDGDHGAVITTHDVTISTFQAKANLAVDEPEVVSKERVPQRYFDEDQPTFTVPPEGTNEANFNLTSP